MHRPRPIFRFTILHPTGSPDAVPPRLGLARLARADGTVIEIQTPGLLVATSRGSVPHLARDHVQRTSAIRWAHVYFEDWLDHVPPAPVSFFESAPSRSLSHPDTPALHSFLGLPKATILSLTLRDPADARIMPPNTAQAIAAQCVRGVRTVQPPVWRSYVEQVEPDLVVALSDTPFTPPPHSQRRLEKSNERSVAWLVDMLKSSSPLPEVRLEDDLDGVVPHHPLNVLVHMAGSASVTARAAFASALFDPLDMSERQLLTTWTSLAQAVCGFVVDLVPLRAAVAAALEVDQSATSQELPSETPNKNRNHTPKNTPSLGRGASVVQNLTESSDSSHAVTTECLLPLIRASLEPVSAIAGSQQQASLDAASNGLPGQIRVVTSARSPHEMLLMIQHCGIDAFDARWAQRAADIGVALDFTFPALDKKIKSKDSQTSNQSGMQADHAHKEPSRPRQREDGRYDIGHNLYDPQYAHAYTRLASGLLDSRSLQGSMNSRLSGDRELGRLQDNSASVIVCPCAACSPRSTRAVLSHSAADARRDATQTPRDAEPGQAPPNASSIGQDAEEYEPPFTRAYLHHLLHTHEMSSHALLTMHNLSVLDAFFHGIRKVLAEQPTELSGAPSSHSGSTDDGVPQAQSAQNPFHREVRRFFEEYDEKLLVMDEAHAAWREVELARGRGRLAREKTKQSETTLGTATQLD